MGEWGMLNRDVKKIFRRIWIKTPKQVLLLHFLYCCLGETTKQTATTTTVITSNNKNKQKGPMTKPTHRK
jgi:hypothetical protein